MTKELHRVAAKLETDELKLQNAIGQVKLLTEERDKLHATVIELTQQNKTLTDEKQKALSDVKTTIEVAKTATEAAKLAKTKLDTLKEEIKELRLEKEKDEEEIESLRKLWEESSAVHFHVAIKQIKFLNLGVELITWGMSTLCVVQNGKWYHVEPTGNVESVPGDEEPASTVLVADECQEKHGDPNPEGTTDEEKGPVDYVINVEDDGPNHDVSLPAGNE
ncbi:putative myosin-2 heavy chain isoform X2 [Sesbania bispinosa]|nr:putative myosin-2 heavy chain isoform X2 [Sesbania bispinosa]